MRDIQRYVGMVYFATFALCGWLFPKILVEIFGAIGPGFDQNIVASIRLSTFIGVGLSLLMTALLWRSKLVRRWTEETVEQLAKTTWPDSDETRESTIIVIGFSVVLGCLLAIMDVIGKHVIDLIFQVFS